MEDFFHVRPPFAFPTGVQRLLQFFKGIYKDGGEASRRTTKCIQKHQFRSGNSSREQFGPQSLSPEISQTKTYIELHLHGLASLIGLRLPNLLMLLLGRLILSVGLTLRLAWWVFLATGLKLLWLRCVGLLGGHLVVV